MSRLLATQLPLDPEYSLDDMLDVSKKWIQGSRHAPFNKDSLEELQQHGDALSKNGCSVVFAREQGVGYEVAGLKYAHPGNRDGELFTSHIVGVHDHDKFYVSMAIDYDNSQPGSTPPRIRRPVLLKMLLQQMAGGSDAGLMVRDTPVQLRTEDREMTTTVISGRSTNILPVVYVSRDQYNATRAEPHELARDVGGLAHVLVEPDRDFSFHLRDATHGANTYGGAVGIYWPFGQGRKIIFPERGRITSSEIQDLLVSTMCHQRFARELTWEHIQSLHNEKRMQALKNDSLSSADELMEIYIEELDAKQKQIDDAEKRNSQLEQQLRKLQHRQVSSGNGKLLNDPQLIQAWDGEISDIILAALGQVTVESGSRAEHFIQAIMQTNKISQTRQQRIDEINTLFKSYSGMTGSLRRSLREMGFEVVEDGKHVQVYHISDESVKVTMSATPSDHRVGKNIVITMKRMFF